MATVNISSGPANRISLPGRNTPVVDVISNVKPTPALPDLVLIVAINNQTAFNLPGNETRRVLIINGLEAEQDEYHIANNVLTWTGPYTLATTDELILSA